MYKIIIENAYWRIATYIINALLKLIYNVLIPHLPDLSYNCESYYSNSVPVFGWVTSNEFDCTS